MATTGSTPSLTHRELRGMIVENLRRDLLGPSDPHEALRERPRGHDLLGMLAPAGAVVEVEDTEEDVSAEDDEASDETAVAGSAKGLQRSSLGLAIAVEETEKAELHVRVGYAI